MKKITFNIACGICSAAILLASQAQAQVRPQVEPGRFDSIYDRQDRPDVSGEPIIDFSQDKDQQDTTESGTAFSLKNVNFTGSSVLPPEKLNTITSNYVGKRVTLGSLRKMVNEITALLRTEGFITSRAILPPQKVNSGVVTVEIIEGNVDKVLIQGEFQGDRRILERFANRVREASPLTIQSLERYLLLIDDLPGVTARAILRPSELVGHTDIVIDVQQKTAEFALTADNFNSRFLGAYKGDAIASLNSSFGGFGRTTVRGIMSGDPDELKYINLQHEFQLGYEGTRLLVSGSYTETEPGQKLERLGLEGTSSNLSARMQHPFIRSRRENLYGLLGVSFNASESDAFDIEQFHDEVNKVEVGFAYDLFDRLYGTTRIDATYSRGFDILGASESTDLRSRANADGEFDKVNVELARLQSIPGTGLSIYLAGTGQYAWTPLLSSEEFGLGGQQYGRAFDPSEITGDRGVGGTGEIRYLFNEPFRYVRDLQPFAFYDVGKVWNLDTFAGEAKDASLQSVGAGTRFNLDADISGQVLAAFPLIREVESFGTDGDEVRFLFSVTKRF